MKKLTLDIYIISRCTHNYYARELKKLHLTMGQFPFIMGIAEHDGISQEKLSSEMMISKSTTAVVVQQLLKHGLITRDVDEADRRNFKLHATAKALRLVPEIEAMIDRCHRIITEDLTEIECSILAGLLEKVRKKSESSLGGKSSGGRKKGAAPRNGRTPS